MVGVELLTEDNQRFTDQLSVDFGYGDLVVPIDPGREPVRLILEVDVDLVVRDVLQGQDQTSSLQIRMGTTLWSAQMQRRVRKGGRRGLPGHEGARASPLHRGIWGSCTSAERRLQGRREVPCTPGAESSLLR